MLDRAPTPAAPPQERRAVRPASSTTGPERLRLEDVSIAYGTKPAVKSVSLSIHQGEVLALIGPSGCGKTTLLRTLNRLTELTPSAARAGRIRLDGEDIHELLDTSLRSRVAMVFQQPNPFPMSIFDNVAFALREQSRSRPRRKELEPLVIDALRRAGLYDEVQGDLDARPAPLRRPAAAPVHRPGDRPPPRGAADGRACSALDPISTDTIEQLIGELRRDLAVVVVTHNLAQARRIADKVAFMYLGDLSSTARRERSSTSPGDPYARIRPGRLRLGGRRGGREPDGGPLPNRRRDQLRQLRRRGRRRPALLPVLRSPGLPVRLGFLDVLQDQGPTRPRRSPPATLEPTPSARHPSPSAGWALDPPQRRHLRAPVGAAAVPDRRLLLGHWASGGGVKASLHGDQIVGLAGASSPRRPPLRPRPRPPEQSAAAAAKAEKRNSRERPRKPPRKRGRESAAPGAGERLPEGTREIQPSTAKSTPENSTPKAPNR